jgi:hypothetical protein
MYPYPLSTHDSWQIKTRIDGLTSREGWGTGGVLGTHGITCANAYVQKAN